MLLRVLLLPACVCVVVGSHRPGGAFGERILSPVALMARTVSGTLADAESARSTLNRLSATGELLNCFGALSYVILLMPFFTLYRSKIEVLETCLFDVVDTYNGHPSYVKHVLGNIYVFFTLFGCWVCVWGGSQGIGTQPSGAAFHPIQLKNGSSKNLLS